MRALYQAPAFLHTAFGAATSRAINRMVIPSRADGEGPHIR
jgi:hypothetical protein